MKQINEFILRGTIINLNISSKVASARLAVEGRKGLSNYPNIVFFDTSLLKGFSVQQRVIIKGHTQNRMIENPLDTKKKVTQTSLVADSIYPARRMLLDYFKDSDIFVTEGGAADDINRIVWAGTVLNLYIPDAKNPVSFLRVGNKTEELHRQCDFSCFDRNYKYTKKLQVGDSVFVVGKATTTAKSMGGKTIYYQNVIAQDIFSAEVEKRKQESDG